VVVRQDRGASPVEFAIVAAAMLFLSFAVVQVGLVFYARSIALAAATQGANAARGYNANNEAGQAASQRFLDAAGDGLRDQNITVRRVGNDVTVTVTGNAVSVLPGFNFGINQSARGSIERVT
jgi:Flp pilus assembly protein TadG